MKPKIILLGLVCAFLSSCQWFFSSINYSPSQKVKPVSYSDESPNPAYHFYYSDTTDQLYLRELRQKYELDKLIADKQTEIEKIKAVLHWTNSQWEHNGSNTPSESDPLTILKEASEGKQFRCVEYGILAASSLNAVGIPARVLGLKTRDVAKVRHGAAHVVAEVYSSDLDKWIFIDPQLDILPTLEGLPLNAVEFREAIMQNKNQLELINAEGVVGSELADGYLDWIGKYLYFLDVNFDQRVGKDLKLKAVEGKPKLMLVPLEAENPTVFQRKFPINYCVYTHSIKDFYQQPAVY